MQSYKKNVILHNYSHIFYALCAQMWKAFVALLHVKKYLYFCKAKLSYDNIMSDHNISISEAQHMVDDWIHTYGVRYFSELTNMAVLTEEVGELARIMSRKYGDQSFKAGEPQDPTDEMADILWVLLCLANQTGVDLTDAFVKNLEKKTKRDATRHITNPKLNA